MVDLRRHARAAAYTTVGLQVLALRAVATRVRTFGPTAGSLLEQAGPLGEVVGEAAPDAVRRWLGRDAAR
jgi:hypothetical protein